MIAERTQNLKRQAESLKVHGQLPLLRTLKLLAVGCWLLAVGFLISNFYFPISIFYFPIYFHSPSAARSLRTTRSCPSATIVSKSGGATDCPTIATRVALISNPAFTPPSSAAWRDAWSQAS